MSEDSRKLIMQRMHNRLFEICEWIVEEDDDPALGFVELINYWLDYWEEGYYSPPVFTPTELAKLSAVDAAMQTFRASTPDNIYLTDVPRLFASHEWKWLVHAASLAVIEFRNRGRFSEVVEE